MDHLASELQHAVEQWDARGWPRPHAMTVSGSGLGTSLGETLEPAVPWAELIPFEVRGIEGHDLELELLRSQEGCVVLSSRGRIHAYQGYTPAQVVFPVRLAALLGVRVLLMTNSTGGLLPELRAGDLILICDQLNLSGMNPLYGSFPKAWGPQFPDMVNAYDPRLRQILREAAETEDIPLREGVYAGLAGPSYETPAEVRMLRGLGGDVVGMSTVQEIIAAHHMGMVCGGISLVSNPGAGVTDEVLDHEDVLVKAGAAAGRVGKILQQALQDPRLLEL